MSRAATTAATAISRRGRTSSTTGSSFRNCRTRWPISPMSASMRCRPRATTCATSPPTSGPAWRRARSRIPASGRRFCGSTPRCIRNSRSCRASSRSPSPRPNTTAPRSRFMTSVSRLLQERRRRDRVRGTGRRRARPHAVHRKDHQAVCARPRHPQLCRGDPARLQPVRPPRQHLQGADQDTGARARHREIRQKSRRSGSRCATAR